MTARIEKVVTSGMFTLDGQDFEVDNNVWVVGDDREVLVIDAAHDPAAILAAVGDRRLSAIVCTHGHNDHINAAPRVAEATGAPILLHQGDEVLWRMIYPDTEPDGDLGDEQVIEIAATPLRVLHHGGPGATGRSYSDRDTIIASIKGKLLGLPPATVVHTGHGEDTTIGGEAAQFRE